MLQRVGVSINDKDLRRIRVLQRRFGLRSRSEFFRELVKRYQKLEREFQALTGCLTGYLEHPESSEDSAAILKQTLQRLPPEEWK